MRDRRASRAGLPERPDRQPAGDVSDRAPAGPGLDGVRLQGAAPGPGSGLCAEDHGFVAGVAAAGDPRAVLGRGRAAANLLHPHVVTIHNLGSVDGHHFIEMEYVPGGRTLRDTLVHEGPLEPARAATLARQIVLAMGAAHDSGLVHRDIKPANVLLTQQGDAKLADFGLVRRLDELAHGGPRWRGRRRSWRPSSSRAPPPARGPTSMRSACCYSIASRAGCRSWPTASAS